MTIGIGGGISLGGKGGGIGVGGRIGLGIPGLSISVGGGIGVGGRKGCKSHDPSKKWTQVQNVQDHEVVEAAKFAVYVFNHKHGNALVFQFVLEAWVVKSDQITEYSIELVAKDCLHRPLKFHAVVLEKTDKTKELVSFDQIV